MPLVSLLDYEKSIKLNHLLNQVNSVTGANTKVDTLIYQMNHNKANCNKNNTNLQVQAKMNSNVKNQNQTDKTAKTKSSANSSSNKQSSDTRYKTELCRQFVENGECKYGDKCQFAHGKEDLKHVNRHPKYKTNFCKTFHSKGFCPYGPRCHFIHDMTQKFELLNTPQLVSRMSDQSLRPFTLDNLGIDENRNYSLTSDRDLSDQKAKLLIDFLFRTAISNLSIQLEEDPQENNDVFSDCLLTGDSISPQTPQSFRSRSSTLSTSSIYSTSSASSFYNSDSEISCDKTIDHPTSPINRQFKHPMFEDKSTYLEPMNRPNSYRNDILMTPPSLHHQQQTTINLNKNVNLFSNHQIIW